MLISGQFVQKGLRVTGDCRDSIEKFDSAIEILGVSSCKRERIRRGRLSRRMPANDAVFGINAEMLDETLVPEVVFRDLDDSVRNFSRE